MFHIDHELLASYTKEASINIMSVLIAISKKTLNKQLKPTDRLLSIPLLKDADNLLPEQKYSMQKMILQAFPAIKIIMDSRIARKGKVGRASQINQSIPVSYSFGDTILVLMEYCHVLDCLRYNKEMQSKTICGYLRILLKAALKTLRSNYKYNNNSSLSLLPENGLCFFIKGMVVKDRDRHRDIFNENWLFYPGKENISDIGKVELISLFLSSERIFKFLSDTKVLERFPDTAPKSNLTQRQIVFSILSCYNIRFPRKSINIRKDKIENVIEIFNTLRQCPEELYPVLPCEKQAEFNFYDAKNRRILMRRRSDTFPYLILQYFDYNNCFDKLRFGIHIGSVSRKLHDLHSYADGNQRERFVKDNISCFASINKAYDYSKDLSTIIKYGDFCRDRINYIRNGENFALSLSEKMPRVVDGNIMCAVPDCWISKYELEAMAFYEYLRPGDAERIIEDAYHRVRSSYRSNSVQKTDSSKNYVKLILKETEDLIVDIKRRENTISRGNAQVGSRKYVRIKARELAAYIIKDAVFWMEKDKPSGLQYAVVKGMLTNFDGRQYTFDDICRGFNNIRIKIGEHPILKRIRSSESVFDLYKKYLYGKKQYLTDILQSGSYPIVMLRNQDGLLMEDSYQHPVFLPRHIFREAIIEALMEKSLSYSGEEKCSLNSLVQDYFNCIEDDQSQPMYLWPRRNQYGHYRLWANNPSYTYNIKTSVADKEKRIVDSLHKENPRHKYRTVTNKETFEKEFLYTKKKMKKSEKQIRRHRTNDIILFLLARKCIGSEFANMKLKDIDSRGNNLPKVEITQKLSLQMDTIDINIGYLSSLKDSGLIYKLIEDSNFQQYVLDKSNKTNGVALSSQEIVSLFGCQMRD